MRNKKKTPAKKSREGLISRPNLTTIVGYILQPDEINILRFKDGVAYFK